jgi:hypothetical protein
MKEAKFEYAGIQVTLTPVGRQVVVSNNGEIRGIMPALSQEELRFLVGKAKVNPNIKGPFAIESESLDELISGTIDEIGFSVYPARQCVIRVYLVIGLDNKFAVEFRVLSNDDAVIYRCGNLDEACAYARSMLEEKFTRHERLVSLGIIPKDTPEPQGD